MHIVVQLKQIKCCLSNTHMSLDSVQSSTIATSKSQLVRFFGLIEHAERFLFKYFYTSMVMSSDVLCDWAEANLLCRNDRNIKQFSRLSHSGAVYCHLIKALNVLG